MSETPTPPTEPTPPTPPTPPPPTAPEAAGASDVSPSEPPAPASDAPAAPPAATRSAKPITSTVLRAAARTPKDVREIVEAESKVKEHRAQRRLKGGSSVFASAVEASRPAAAAKTPVTLAPPLNADTPVVATATTTRPLAVPPPQPAPLPRTPPALRPAAETSRAVVAAPPVGRPVVPSPPSLSAPRPPTPAPAPAPPPPPQVIVTAPRSSWWPVVMAMLASAGLSAGGLYLGARLVAEALATARQASAVAPAPAPAAAPPPTAGPGGQLASIGGDRVIYTTAEGHLLVLRPDPASGELEVERAYAVSRDLERHLGEDSRQLHGYYLDDIEAVRRAELEAAQRRYELSIAEAGANRASAASAEAAALELVRAGGADRLARDLTLDGASSDPAVNVRRRAAALALGESGYVAAAPLLLELLQQGTGDLRVKAAAALARVTGLTLDPTKPEEAVTAVKAWLERHPAGRPFERVDAPR